jgi:hypothetical protein
VTIEIADVCTPRPSRLALSRLSWGVACLLVPSYVISALGGPVDRPTLIVTRVLGVRHIAQGTVSALMPSRRVLAAGGLVDLIHGASMTLVGRLDPDRRRLAWIDAAIAAAWAAATIRAASCEPSKSSAGESE